MLPTSYYTALERLRTLKKASAQIGVNAREAVRFLDRVTSCKHDIPANRIVLQGPMEQYEVWDDAQAFFLPEYEVEVVEGRAGEAELHKSEPAADGHRENQPAQHKETQSLNEMSQMLLSKLNFKQDSDLAHSAGSGPVSLASESTHSTPEYKNAQLVQKQKAENAGIDVGRNPASVYMAPPVPEGLKPLLNSVLWRLHQPATPAVSNSYVLVSNDPVVQSWARKYGINVKNIHQLRTAIIYEEKEYKNHRKYLEKTQASPEQKTLLSHEEESDEDELVFVPRGKGASHAAGNRKSGPRKTTGSKATNGVVNGNGLHKEQRFPSRTPGSSIEIPSSPIDPDSFSRSVVPRTSLADLESPKGAGRGNSAHSPRGRRRPSRGGGAFRGSPRGRGKLWVPS